MTSARPRTWRLAGLALATACQDLPKAQYHTEHLELATDFDAPVCEGTLDMLDRVAGRIVSSLASEPTLDRFQVHWLEHSIDDVCDDATGCFYANTRMVFARGRSITHELVHATIDSGGEAFFVEEGIAELMGGSGVHSNPTRLQGRLAEQLALPSHDYRHGALSYPEAAHFVQWLRDEEGPWAIHQLAADLAAHGTAADIRARLEDVLHLPIAEIEDRYVETARVTYPGTMDDLVDEWVLWPTRSVWATLAFECDDPSVLGPLPGALPGMYRVVRLKVPEAQVVRIDVDGDPGTHAELFTPYATDEQPPALWWPDEDAGRLARLEPGDRVRLPLEVRTYLLMLVAHGDASAQMDVRITSDAS